MRALPLIISICALALIAVPASAEDVIIPVNKDFNNGDIVVHVLMVTITDKYWGNTYSPDPENTTWPKVWFTYENKGTVPIHGNLYVAFADDKGNKYWDSRDNTPIADITMDPIEPGETSDERFIEAAVPRGTNITKAILYDYARREAMVIDTSGASPASPTAATPTAIGGSPACLSLLLPLFLLSAVVALGIKR